MATAVCSVCSSPATKRAVERLRRQGASIREIAAQLGNVGYGSVQRHCANHMDAAPSNADLANRDGHLDPTAVSLEPETLAERVVPLLRRGPMSVDELASALQVDALTAGLAARLALAKGAAISLRGQRWHLDRAPALGTQTDPHLDVDGQSFALTTGEDDTVTFAALGDTHLCSKYERLDCLEDFYDTCVRRGIGIALHQGNYVDGESHLNVHDLKVHGFDEQLRYVVQHYPQRPGVETLAITGADHEGWWAKKHGIDVGRTLQHKMREAGRTDWHDMGYMECYIPIVNGKSGERSMLLMQHPGGGSSYAYSYKSQKIVEGFQGGDKPAILLIGHYHKSLYSLVRNVYTFQTGCFLDQTVFMRQKGLEAHVGGWFITAKSDPRTGAITQVECTWRNYYNRGYYNGRWSNHGRVRQVERVAGA